MAAKRKTALEIVNEANELARQVYTAYGVSVPKGYRFDYASHPQEMAIWRNVALAYKHISGIDIDAASEAVEEAEKKARK